MVVRLHQGSLPPLARCVLLTAVCSGLFALAAALLSPLFTYGQPGTTDFIQYWSSFRALQSGLNPYNGEVLHQLQVTAGQSPHATVLMWNPPWTPLLLAPLLSFSFPTAAAGWFLFSAVLLVLIARLAPYAVGKTSPPLLALVVALALFTPILDCLALGQLSIVLSAVLTLIFVCIRAKRLFIAGALTFLLTVKPHLFLLLVPLMGLWLWQLPGHEQGRFGSGVAVAAGVVLAATHALWPDAISDWLHSLGGTPSGPGTVPIAMWKTTTLASFIRILMQPLYGEPPFWPLWFVPLLGVFCASAFLFLRRHAAHEPYLYAPYFICLSLLCTNYGWLFDQSLLALCIVSILCDVWAQPHRNVRLTIIGGVVAIHAGVAALVLCTQPTFQHYFVWVPAALFLLLATSEKLRMSHVRDRSNQR